MRTLILYIIGLIGFLFYFTSCKIEIKRVKSLLRYVSYAFPLICVPLSFNIIALLYAIFITIGQLVINKSQLFGILSYVISYTMLNYCSFIKVGFNETVFIMVCFLYFIILAIVSIYINRWNGKWYLKLGVYFYAIFVLLPLFYNSIMMVDLNSLSLLFLIVGDILLAVSFYTKHVMNIKTNKFMYPSQLFFYVSVCGALSIF